MSEGTISADWAWISKDPEGGIGYSILKDSAATIDFPSLASRYVPGSPSSTIPEGAPDAPPWVTIGPGEASADDVLISVSVRDPWRELDDSGRPVWPQRLLVVPFTELAKADASYRTIWEAVRGAEVPAPAAKPVSLKVAPRSRAKLLDTFERHRFDRIAALASALLDGPVAIADATHLTREERLDLLDAVAALLPYGFRVDLSVSSSVNNTAQHGIRLVFATFPNEGQQLISLVHAAPKPHGDWSSRYQTALHDKLEVCELPDLLDHMWGKKGKKDHPYSFDDPGRAFAALMEIDFYGGILRDLAKQPIELERILKFFADPARVQQSWPELDEHTRNNALASLLVASDARVAGVLVHCWDFLGADVNRRINAELDAGKADLAMRCLSMFRSLDGGEDHLEDSLLAEILIPAGEHLAKQRWDRRLTMLVGLLQWRGVPEVGRYVTTCDDLRFGESDKWQARLVRELLARELASSGDDARALEWVQWLCQTPFSGDWDRPGWVMGLGYLLGRPVGDQALYNVRLLARRDALWTLVLLRLARCANGLGALLNDVSPQLIELAASLKPAVPGNAAAQLADELAPKVSALDVRAAALAQVDLVRVLLGGRPEDFPFHVWPAAYGAALREALESECVRPRLASLADEFLARAVYVRTEHDRLTAGGVSLLNEWSVDQGRKHDLIRYLAAQDTEVLPMDERLILDYWHAVGEHPNLVGYAATGELLATVDWTKKHPDIAFEHRDTSEGMTNTRLAYSCYRARRAGLPVDQIIRALATAGAAAIAPGALDEVLREFQGLRFHLAPREDRAAIRRESRDELVRCYWLILQGGLGKPYAEAFARYLERSLQNGRDTRDEVYKLLFPKRRNRALAVLAPGGAQASTPQAGTMSAATTQAGRAQQGNVSIVHVPQPAEARFESGLPDPGRRGQGGHPEQGRPPAPPAAGPSPAVHAPIPADGVGGPPASPVESPPETTVMAGQETGPDQPGWSINPFSWFRRERAPEPPPTTEGLADDRS